MGSLKEEEAAAVDAGGEEGGFVLVDVVVEEEKEKKKKKRPLLLTHVACAGHHIRHHPEQPRRVTRIEAAVIEAHGASVDHERDAARASLEAVERFHTSAHVERVLRLCSEAEEEARRGPFIVGKKMNMMRARGTKSRRHGVRHIDEDTGVMAGTREAAFRAAGAAICAVDAVLGGGASSAFACVRPPGHHATPSRAMGFCLFNNVAIAVTHARALRGVKRIAVVDVDVHHGNGTEDGFAGDPETLYCSFHQFGDGFYPETGGGGDSAPNIVNCLLKRGDGSSAVRDAFEGRILPALGAFKAELLFISLGFDALAADPIGGLRLEPRDYAWMTTKLCAAVDGGRVVSVLEGGYDLDAISRAAVAHVGACAHVFRAPITTSSSASCSSRWLVKGPRRRLIIADARRNAVKTPTTTTTMMATGSDASKAAPTPGKVKHDGLVWEDIIDSATEEEEEEEDLSSGTEWGSGDYSDVSTVEDPGEKKTAEKLGEALAAIIADSSKPPAVAAAAAAAAAPEEAPPPSAGT